MSTTLFQHSKHPVQIDSDTEVGYNPPSALGLALSFVLMFIAGFGLIWPNFFSLNLSIMHCLALGGSGVMSLYAVVTKDKRKTFWIYIGLSGFFLLHAILGWALGEPGTTARFAFYTPDQLDRYAPGFMELATIDHVVHATLSVLFFSEAIVWREWLKGDTEHEAQKKAFLRIAKYAAVVFVVAAVMIVVDQIQRSPAFLNN